MKKVSSSLIIALCFIVCLSLVSCVRKQDPSSTPAESTTVTGTTTATSVTGSSNVSTTTRSSTTTKRSVSLPTTLTSTSGTSTTTTTASTATVRVLIPAGSTLVDMAKLMDDNNVCSKEDFLNIAQNYKFTGYKLLIKMPSSNRYYKLEGYLYPGEYDFTVNMTPQKVIEKMLTQAEKYVADKYTYSGLTMDQIITLASLLQKETDDREEMQRISSVLHNRRGAKLSLQVDSTVEYVANVLCPNLTTEIARFDNYYNTYVCADLPVGPIASPGADALYAAVNPVATDYLYYFRDAQGNAHFAVTEAEYRGQREAADYTPPTLPPTEPTATTTTRTAS